MSEINETEHVFVFNGNENSNTGECHVRIGSRMYKYIIGVKGASPRREYIQSPDGQDVYLSDLVELVKSENTHKLLNMESLKWSYKSVDFQNRNKILILGFPHCGTTVLRTKMGDCLNAMEVTREIDFVCKCLSENHPEYKIIVKSADTVTSPITLGEYNDDFDCLKIDKNIPSVPPSNNKFYHDYHSILIIKNPYEVFGSISRRAINNESVADLDESNEHSFEAYEKYAKVWLKYRESDEERYNCIKYEEMFEDNFKCLKNLFSKIGLKYEEDIFENRKNYYSVEDVSFAESRKICNFFDRHDAQPFDHEHETFRAWQIHQKFEPMTNPESYKDIPSELLQRIKDSEIVKELGYLPPE